MITLDELIEIVLIESGAFVGGLEYSNLNIKMVELLFAKELALYSRYMPMKKSFISEIYHRKVFTIQEDGIVPDCIISIRQPTFTPVFYTGKKYGELSSTMWRYNKPVLELNMPGGIIYDEPFYIDTTAHHIYDRDNQNYPTINLDNREFIDLCTAAFLIAYGRGRRTLTVQDLPFQNDSQETVAEGNQLRDTTIFQLKERSNFYLAYLTT